MKDAAELDKRLREFTAKYPARNKGALCVALVITHTAQTKGLPLDPDSLLTKGEGQVTGLSKPAVQAILKRHGITMILAEEAGRTSRGSVGNMRKYVGFLNSLHKANLAKLDEIESWWTGQVREFFAEKPFTLALDASQSLRASLSQMLGEVRKRQKDSPGSTFLGTVLQHLVGAKLEIAGAKGVQHHGASVADEASGREADFFVGDSAIHVTTAPTEALIRKCANNLAKGHVPIIMTLSEHVPGAKSLAEQFSAVDRIEVIDVEQFLVGNIHERGEWQQQGRRATTQRLLQKYNDIVAAAETDPSLRILLK